MSLPPDIRIHRQKRRSMVLKVTPVGIVVFIPKHLKETSPTVQKFIADALERVGPREFPSPIEQTSPDALRALVDEWAVRLGVQPKRVQLRDMYRKWGSCSSIGNITLNTALCRVAPPLAEYVVLHELVHMRVFNHGKEFKAMMSAHMPDWKVRETALNALLARKT